MEKSDMNMYNFTQIKDLSPFQAYIPKEIHEKIASLKWIAFGAFQQSSPVGICIASLDLNTALLEILHLEVDIAHRDQEIGTTLLSKTQEEASKQGARIFSFIYPIETPETPMIEKILKANQWKGSRPFLIKAWFNPETFDTPLIHLPYQYPPGYKEFLWKNLSPDQRKDLLRREQQRHFSRILSPFNDEKILEPSNSLGIEYNGRVVGWLITHRIDQEMVRYSIIYIEPSLKFQGSLAVKLMIDAMLLHLEKLTTWGLFEIPYLQVSSSWIHFVEKRLLPSAVKITRYRQGWHTK
jgi:hypothetical protein